MQASINRWFHLQTCQALTLGGLFSFNGFIAFRGDGCKCKPRNELRCLTIDKPRKGFYETQGLG